MTDSDRLEDSFYLGIAESTKEYDDLPEDSFGIGTVLLFRYKDKDDKVAVKIGRGKWNKGQNNLSWKNLMDLLFEDDLTIIECKPTEVVYSKGE